MVRLVANAITFIMDLLLYFAKQGSVISPHLNIMVALKVYTFIVVLGWSALEGSYHNNTYYNSIYISGGLVFLVQWVVDEWLVGGVGVWSFLEGYVINHIDNG